MNAAVLAAGSILLSVTAQFLLKLGMGSAATALASGTPAWRAHVNGWLGLGFACYLLGAVLWLAVLSRWEVSKAYPMVGAGFAVTLVVGYALGESVGPIRMVGVALICVGIILVSTT